jgi:hypothetical protein
VEALARSLTGERRALELLLFKLVAARNLLADGDDRFDAWASAELDRVIGLVRDSELHRALTAPDNRTLADIAATAPAPYGTILDDHRAALRELLGEIEALRDLSGALARGASDRSQALTANTCGLSLASLSEFLA